MTDPECHRVFFEGSTYDQLNYLIGKSEVYAGPNMHLIYDHAVSFKADCIMTSFLLVR